MTKTFTLYWIAADKQADFNMGTFATRAEAEAAIPAAEAELIEQAGEQYQKDQIKAGSWQIDEEGE